MKKRPLPTLSKIMVPLLAAISIFAGGLFFSRDSGAILPQVLNLESQGSAAFIEGDFDLARRRFGEAEALALQLGDWDGLLFLSVDYLILTVLDAGHENDNQLAARSCFVNATSIAYDKAIYSPDRPGSGRDCLEGLRGLRAVEGLFNVISPALTPGAEFDAYEAQRNIAAQVTACIEDPALTATPTPTPSVSPTPTPTPSTSPTTTSNTFDIPFGTPQFLVHSIGHGTLSGDVVDDFYFLFPNGPTDGRLETPDGSGGTFTYKIDFSAGPFTTPRGVCVAAQGRGVGNQTFTAWNGNTSFNCSELPPA